VNVQVCIFSCFCYRAACREIAVPLIAVPDIIVSPFRNSRRATEAGSVRVLHSGGA
jgi:hypothetical protein